MQYPFLFLFIIGLMFLHTTDACGKRPMRSTTSSTVPPTTSSMYNSSEGTTTPYSYKLPCNRTETRLMGCLHKGTCFVIIIQKTRERNCNCPHKWTGKRCQELSPELFAPITDPNKLRTAHIAAGVVGTIIIVLVIVSSVYCYVRVKKKERSMPHRHRQNGANNTHVNSLGKEVPALELQPLGQAV